MDTSFRIAVNRGLERTAWGWAWPVIVSGFGDLGYRSLRATVLWSLARRDLTREEKRYGT